MSGQLISTIFGSACIGWLVPEFFVVISSGKARVPSGMNWLCAIGCAALAYGLRG